jgi:nitrite reductase/ring-hydroxylating ferredoxin subunit
MGDEQAWTEIARVGDVAADDVIEVTVGRRCLALFNLGGTHFATAGICTHAHARVATGKAVGAPVSQDLETFAVKVEGDVILAMLPD